MEKVIKLNHNLQNIREKCAEFGDNRFNNDHLKFLTDTCGEHLMEDGRIRYPNKHEMLAFPEFEHALNVLKEITGEVTEKITEPEGKNL